MQTPFKSQLLTFVATQEKELLQNWIDHQLNTPTFRWDLIHPTQLHEQSSEFLLLLRQGIQAGDLSDITSQEWAPLRAMLARLSALRARQGFTPSETAAFIFSFKHPLFNRLEREIKDREQLLNEIWQATFLLDKLGLYTTEVFQKTREDMIVHERERAEKAICRLNEALQQQVQDLEQSKGGLQEQVHELEQSQDGLQDQIHDLELFEQAVVGRELKLMALEKELAELKAEKEKP
jgi:hypothetical protein